MNLKRPAIAAAVAVAATVLAVGPSGAQAETASLPASQICEPMSTAYDVNDAGTVAGYVGGWPNVRAAVCSSQSGLVYLDTPVDATSSIAVTINSVGQTAGQITLASGAFEAAVWDSSGTITRLGFLPGGSTSSAQDINDHGSVVGATYATGAQRPFIWHGSGPIEPLAMPAGMTSAVAGAINNDGIVAGSANAMFVPSAAVIWDGDNVATLPPLAPGRPAWAADINDAGQVVGSCTAGPPEYARHAVLWDDGDIVDLGTLGASFAMANAVNAKGQIAGYIVADPSTSQLHAFVWENGNSTLLDPLSGDLVSNALGINGAGEIVGISSPSATGLGRAVSWTPAASDTTPPVVTAPTGWSWVTVPATSPAGALITDTLEISAIDNVDGPVPVTCQPYTDFLFPIDPIGQFTEVFCSATDSAGNVGTAEEFFLHVEGASEQVSDLIAVVEEYNLDKLGTSLTDKLGTVGRMLNTNKPAQAVENLDAFISQVRGQSGKGLTVDQATRLTDDAQRIRAVIGP